MFVISSVFMFVPLLIVFVFCSGATLVILSSQLTIILIFFLSHNLRSARKHAWDLTVTSRAKGPTFWQPYIEEWDQPPKVDVNQWAGFVEVKGKVLRFAIKCCEFVNIFFKMSTDNTQLTIVLLMSLNVIPVAGLVIKAAFKALDTARHLHKPVCTFYIYHYSVNLLLYSTSI